MSGIATNHARDLLALSTAPGLGPQRVRRLLERFGSPAEVFGRSESELATVLGIGPALARRARQSFDTAHRKADEELAQLEKLGGRAVAVGDENYPALLAPLPDAPPVLFVRGDLDAALGRYPVAIVGSRDHTHYGHEQAGRFASALATAGLMVVSGGARGIDAAAHRAAMAAGGKTVVVLGTGLGVPYPPEHAGLFDEIADSGRGAIVSELPAQTPPIAQNFPSRNRIISGLSLGVLVIEAGRKSGALITARIAAEDHGREVMAVPGRIDSPHSAGCNDLLRAGGAGLVSDPADVIEQLEQSARFAHDETHAARYRAEPARTEPARTAPTPPLRPLAAVPLPETEPERSIMQALAEPKTPDQLAETLGLEIAALRTSITTLDLAGLIRREGTRIARRSG
ncbi:MAG: DNA-processing protein DprA [Planctomycetota bacterium]